MFMVAFVVGALIAVVVVFGCAWFSRRPPVAAFMEGSRPESLPLVHDKRD